MTELLQAPGIQDRASAALTVDGEPDRLSGAREPDLTCGFLRTTSFCLLALWLSLFVAGSTVDTRAFRELYGPLPEKVETTARTSLHLQFSPKQQVPLRDFLIIGACYLLPNLALLSCVSGILGCCGRTANLGHDDHRGSNPDDSHHRYLSGALRGFFVYLTIVSGVLVFSDDPFANASAAQYMRTAGFISAVSFSVNYNPELFMQVLRRLDSTVEGSAKRGHKEKPRPGSQV